MCIQQHKRRLTCSSMKTSIISTKKVKETIEQEKVNPQQTTSNSRLHSNTKEAQAIWSDNKLMKGKESNINLFYNPNISNIPSLPLSLFNRFVNDKENSKLIRTSTAANTTTTTTTKVTSPPTTITTQKSVLLTKLYDQFNLKSKNK